MDLRMPGVGGIAATAAPRARALAARVLVLTTYPGQDAILPAAGRGTGLPDQGCRRRADRNRDPRGTRRPDPLGPAARERLVAAVTGLH